MKQTTSDSSWEEEGKGRLGTNICWQLTNTVGIRLASS